uniref:Putative terminase n=2 Tax=viral metagenome TaxID=1070528 RepID=A0A6H1ZZN5_9ZZZZ
MALFLELMRTYGLYKESNHNKTESTYEHNGNWVMFFSLGEGEAGREKIKSANLNIVWLEEATEFSWEDYLQLKLRLRHPAPEGITNFMVLSCNPINQEHWIKRQLIDGV